MPPLSDVMYPKWTVNLQWVGLLIFSKWIHMSSLILWFRQWIGSDASSGQWTWFAIALSVSCISHTFRHVVIFIMVRQTTRINRRLNRYITLHGGQQTAAWNCFGLNQGEICMFGELLIHHIHQSHFLVVGSIRTVVIRMDVYSHVQLPRWLQR